MKRSEMIKLLDSKFIFPEGLPAEILDVLEEAGMMPPKAWICFEDEKIVAKQPPGDLEFLDGEYIFDWESED